MELHYSVLYVLTIPPSCEENGTHEDGPNASNPNGIGPGNVFCVDKSKSGTAKCRCKRIILNGDFRIGKNARFKVGYISPVFSCSLLSKQG